jgi:hypothetical protein
MNQDSIHGLTGRQGGEEDLGTEVEVHLKGPHGHFIGQAGIKLFIKSTERKVLY